MLVQGGSKFLNQMSQGKSQKKLSQHDSDSFESALKGAKTPKKKPVKAKLTKPVKKVTKNDDQPNQQSEDLRVETKKPMRKEFLGSSQRNQGRQGQMVQSVENKSLKSKQDLETLAKQGKNSLFLKPELNEGSIIPHSTQQSEFGKNTLEEIANSLNINESNQKNKDQDVAIVKPRLNQNNSLLELNQETIVPKQKQQWVGQNPLASKVMKVQNLNIKKEGSASDEKLLNELSALSTDGLETTKSLSAQSDKGLNQDMMSEDMQDFLEAIHGGENSTESIEGSSFTEELVATQSPEAKSEKIENMSSIIKQARTFVSEGGGAMEIHLQPEGLGKVHLKVAVEDGHVNVEMMTDNLQAKKALEEGLFDVKSALEGQKLLVDTLKVEMSPDYQKDFSDLQNHMEEQANRDFAEQFLGQFKQEREERFTGMFDAFKNFQRGSKEDELTLARNPYADSGKGRSINLVA